jgi:fructosamine-3-kinase
MFFSTIIEKWMDKTLIEVTPLFGGDINQVYRLRFSDSESVLKLNDRNRYPGMFEKEATGLKKIAATGCRAPRVLKTFSEGNHQFLILEFIEQERPNSKFWERFGRHLARLHSTGSATFGWEEDNYIGSLEQRNERREKWTDFFIDSRIIPLVEQAREKGLLTQSHSRQFEVLFKRLPQLVPQEGASLIHGDLWSGNLMCGIGMEPVFIDPAAYFGHREMDLAMTRMFGGFDQRFMNSYNEVLPLEPGFEQRVDIHNLYPNLVHLVLFGRSYLGNIERTLRENL